MAVDTSYLLSIGYSEKDISEYEHQWAEGILEFLSANQTNVMENMRFLQKEMFRMISVSGSEKQCLKLTPERNAVPFGIRTEISNAKFQ